MKKILIYYCFILSNTLVIMGFIGATNPAQLISAILFYPLGVYFLLLVIPRRQKAIPLPIKKPPADISLLSLTKEIYSPLTPSTSPSPAIESPLEIIHGHNQPSIHTILDGDIDIDRRRFLKIIGSTSITIFMLSIFTKKAQAAFFGSVPGPGTVALKDPNTGLQITPAQDHPTDGFRIAQLDDSTPAYYGFTDKDGAWYIMREDTSGNYRYSQGGTDFSTNWTNRTSLSYDYFDVVF